MTVYADAKDTRETDSFPFDWSPRLGAGETIASLALTWVSTAGASVVAATSTDTVTRVVLSGGSAGSTAKWIVAITTNAGRVIDEDFSVEIVDKAVAEATETDVARLTRQIGEAKAQRHSVALGEATIEVMRDGRKVVRKISSMAELEDYIRLLESELALAQVDAGVTPRRSRRAISLGYRN